MKDIIVLNPAGFIGGAEKSLIEFLNINPDRINLVIIPFHGMLCEELQNIGIEYIIVEPDDKFNEISRSSGKVVQFISFIRYSLKIYRIIKRRQFRYIYSNGLKTNIISILLKFLMWNKKIIWHFRDINSKYINIIFNILSVFTKKIICNSEYTLKQFFTEKGILIYNPIFFNNKSSNTLQKKISKTKKICISGHITELKNIHIAVMALKYLDKDIVLNIYGECPYKTENNNYKKFIEDIIFRENLENRVFFHGFKKNISEIYSNNDLLISLSKKESFGRTAFEALSYNIPVIVSKTGFFHDKNFVIPYIIPINKLHAQYVASKINQVFNNYEDYCQKNIDFFVKIKHEFDTMKINKKIIQLFD